jgi:hypothetical protein
MGPTELRNLVAYIVAEAKLYGPGCGGATNIAVLPRIGKAYLDYPHTIAAGEKYFTTILNHAIELTRSALACEDLADLNAAVDALKPKLVRAWEDVNERNIRDRENEVPFEYLDDDPRQGDE